MHGMPRISLLFALIGLALTACSSTGKAGSSVASPARYVLPNGVRVLIQEYPSSEVVAVQLWVRAGGRDEAATELGLAHYLEHMLFKGTTTRAKGFVDRDARRHRRQLESRRDRAGAREESRHRGDAAERGHSAATPGPPALRDGVRQPPVRSLRARCARDHPEPDAGHLAGVLPPPLRS